MPIATPEVYSEMLDRAKAGQFASVVPQKTEVVRPVRRQPARV